MRLAATRVVALREGARKLRKLVKLVRVTAYRRGLRHGVAAAVEHAHAPFDQAFASVIDVGAGRGQFALFAGHRFPRATLYCFEPLPASRRKLALVTSRRSGIELFEVALGTGRERASLHVTFDGDSSSLLEIGHHQLRFNPGSGEQERLSVPMQPLDEALAGRELERPCLLKIDVQGSELEVLRGGEATLPAISQVVVECSFRELYKGQPLIDEVVCHLRERGFQLASCYSLSLDADGSAIQADVLFTRSSAGDPL